jgi:endonuclease-3
VNDLTWGEVATILARRYGPPTRLRNRRDPLEELIFIVLSGRTEEYNYVRTYRSLRRRYRTWTSLRRASVDDIATTIQLGGLAYVKARQIRAILERLERDGHPDLCFLDGLPTGDALRYLSSLPGVGPKTARCVLLFSLDRPVLPVDTHVWRVSGRLGFTNAGHRQPRVLEQERLEASVPASLRLGLHVQLLRHGRETCRSHDPLCLTCPLSARCPGSYPCAR